MTENPLEGLTDEQLKKLGEEVGLRVTLPSDVETEEDIPPTPPFIIRPTPGQGEGDNAYLPDGTPVGVWLHQEHGELSAENVRELLLGMGLESKYADRFARHRYQRDVTAKEALELPAVQRFKDAEDERELRLEDVRAAFLKEQQKKQK